MAAEQSPPPAAEDPGWAEVYQELRRLAGAYMRGDPVHATLQPTALVNEAFVKLGAQPAARDRSHFLALAATAMRHILVDHARAKGRDKRGAGLAQVTLDAFIAQDETGTFDVLVVEDALQRLEAVSERQARIVEMRVFGGMSVEDTATALGVSPRTVKSDWRFARAWLRRELGQVAEQDPDDA